MKVAIISPKYPSPESYSFAFVHARAKLYLKHRLEVQVFVPSGYAEEYEFEGVSVFMNTMEVLKEQLELFHADVLAVHYPDRSVMDFLSQTDLPKVVWIHGHEILWNFRMRSTSSRSKSMYKRLFILPRELIKILKIRSPANRIRQG